MGPQSEESTASGSRGNRQIRQRPRGLQQQRCGYIRTTEWKGDRFGVAVVRSLLTKSFSSAGAVGVAERDSDPDSVVANQEVARKKKARRDRRVVYSETETHHLDRESYYPCYIQGKNYKSDNLSDSEPDNHHNSADLSAHEPMNVIASDPIAAEAVGARLHNPAFIAFRKGCVTTYSTGHG